VGKKKKDKIKKTKTNEKKKKKKDNAEWINLRYFPHPSRVLVNISKIEVV